MTSYFLLNYSHSHAAVLRRLVLPVTQGPTSTPRLLVAGDVTCGETVSWPEWMVVGSDGDCGHCSFTSTEVSRPSLGRLYAYP
jgi:hypothetical protein